ncbi:MAG: efflux RND transporter periplasmic adaptor subunit [Methylophilaceae bacterium]|nr:efflux RND transporter periplasmic adaptor subunit [Methylophilaceae bacterium]
MKKTIAYLLAIASINLTSISFAQDATNKHGIKQPTNSINSTHTSNKNEVVLAANSNQLVNLKIEPVKEIFAPSTEPLNGKITFDENYTSRIGTPIDGRVAKINVQVGDSVKAGQVLMLIDAPDLANALADSHKANADLQLKKQAKERNNMLFEGGVVAKKDVEGTDADYAVAETEMVRANSKLKSLGSSNKMMGENYAIRAPISGFIIDRQVNPGNLLRADAQNPSFIISNPQHLWASIDLPERDLSKVTKNQMVSIEVDAYPNEIFTGRVQSMGQMMDPITRRIQVRCIVDGKGKLKPEMYARVTPISSRNYKVLKIPNSALITDGLYSYVFVEKSTGHLAKTKVTLSSQQLDFSIVNEGLNAGDRVVTVGAILLNSELSSEH